MFPHFRTSHIVIIAIFFKSSAPYQATLITSPLSSEGLSEGVAVRIKDCIVVGIVEGIFERVIDEVSPKIHLN